MGKAKICGFSFRLRSAFKITSKASNLGKTKTEVKAEIGSKYLFFGKRETHVSEAWRKTKKWAKRRFAAFHLDYGAHSRSRVKRVIAYTHLTTHKPTHRIHYNKLSENRYLVIMKSPWFHISKKEFFYFVGFYYISALVYYTASWISWGGFKPGHPPYFHFEEFSASGGVQFLISFLVTIPIWYITSILLRKYNLRTRLLSHLIFLPLYITICYFSLLWVTKIFSWAMYWDGYKIIWTLYIFLLFYLVQFGFIHAYGYFIRFKKEEKGKAELREAVLQSEITALKSQLNPHFLHNLFNSVNATIPPENERTRELIIQLSDLFRYQNYASQNDLVSLKEEITFIKDYLALIKVRFKERLQISFDIDERAYAHQIPPMLLQPLVENAITHGISPKVGVSQLSIRVHVRNELLYFEISDTGIGINNEKDIFEKGIGLSTTRLRLQKMYNSELFIKPNEPTGVHISFSL